MCVRTGAWKIEHRCRSIWTTRISFLPPDGIMSRRNNMQKRHFFRKKRGLEDWRGFASLSPREGTERLGRQPKWWTSQPIRQTSQPYTYFNKTNTETSQPENGQSNGQSSQHNVPFIYRISTVYVPCMYRSCQREDSVETAGRQQGCTIWEFTMYDLFWDCGTMSRLNRITIVLLLLRLLWLIRG